VGASLSIHEAGACLRELRAAMDHGLTEVDASALQVMDTAGVQLLLAAARTVHAQGRTLRITHAGNLLAEATDALGLRAAFAGIAEFSA
jgi:anti-anti-sigma regulatory factor